MSFFSHYSFIGNEEVLDIGCGDGKITASLATQIPAGKIIGIDSSDSMINYAREYYKDQKNISFEHVDVQAISYQKKFDLIVSSFCLQWVPDKKLAFHKITEALKPNGRALLIMPCRNKEMAKIRSEMIAEEKWKAYFEDYFDQSVYVNDSNYDTYALNSGLDIISYEDETISLTFENVFKLRDFLKPITANLSRLPTENLKNEFIDEVIAHYLNIHPLKQNGECVIAYDCIKLYGQKIQSI